MSPFRERLDQARAALACLTRLPVGRADDDFQTFTKAGWVYPFVGIPVGLVGWLVHSGAIEFGLSNFVAAFLAVAAFAGVTGGLHFDGLADFTDGIGGGRDRDHALDIMRDSRIGSFGVLALVLAVGLMAAAIAGTDSDAPLLSAFLVNAVASRLAMLGGLIWLPPARDNGLGYRAGRPDAGALGVGLLLGICVALPLGSAGLLPFLASVVVLFVLGRIAERKIGGQTGDLLGAIQVVAETVSWLVLSAVF